MSAMVEEFEIIVLPMEIEQGVRRAVDRCPVTMAIKRITGLDVRTTCDRVWIAGDTDLRGWLPWKVVDWLCRYDCGAKVHPIRFILNLITRRDAT